MKNIVISKIRAQNPNLHKTKMQNRNYVMYIATRPGVDLSPDVSSDTPLETYVTYIHERPKSHGLFGDIVGGTDDIDAVTKHMYRISKDHVVYKGIVSLTEEDAVELGFNKKEKWVNYITKNIPDIAQEFKIPIQTLQWVAAVHMETGHPHVHYMFWNTNVSPEQSSFIHVNTQQKCREILSKDIFEEERRNLVMQKNLYRDLIIDLGKKAADELDDYDLIDSIVSVPIPPKLYPNNMNELNQVMFDLTTSLPTAGRIAYKLLSPSIKEKVNAVTDKLITIPSIKSNFDSYVSIVNAISDTYSVRGEKKERNQKKAEDDLKTRLGNIVLKTALDLRKKAELYSQILPKPSEQMTSSVQQQASHNSSATLDYYSYLIDDVPKYDYYSDYIMSALPDDEAYDIYFEEVIAPTLTSNNPSDNPSNFSTHSNARSSLQYHVTHSKQYKYAQTLLYQMKDFPKALKLLEQELEGGNLLAALDLGKMHQYGIGVEISHDTAEQFYSQAYNGFLKLYQDSDSKEYIAYRLGKMYQIGQGCTKSLDDAIHWFEKAGTKPYVLYALAKSYMEKPEATKDSILSQKIISMFKSISSANAYAAYELGRIYDRGTLTNIDTELAHEYFSAALNGFLDQSMKSTNDSLMYRIGKMYQQGQGTNIDIKKAIEYFEQSAALNNTYAIFELAKISLEDASLSDKSIPLEILEKLSADGEDMATSALAKYYENIDPAKSIQFYSILANKKQFFALYKLGVIYKNGTIVEPNIPTAVDYFTEAQSLSSPFVHLAQYQLGKIYSDTESPYYDLKKALTYYHQSADIGLNDYAQYQLGRLYLKDELGVFNLDKAIHYLKSSINQGNTFALNQLGLMYLWGKHLPKNEKLGLKMLNEAFDKGNAFAKILIDSYNTFRVKQMAAFSYKLFTQAYSTIFIANENAKSPYFDRRFRSRSKQALKEEAIRKSLGLYNDEVNIIN